VDVALPPTVVNFAATVNDYWDSDTSEWTDCKDSDYKIRGDVWIVKKDGTVAIPQAQSLIDHAGWDGSLESIVNGTWQPTPSSFLLQKDMYNDQERYRAPFVNAYDRVPGALGTVTAEEAKTLQSQFGSQLRALAGNAKRAATAPPNGKPSPKPAAKKAKTPSFTPPAEEAARADGTIPF